MGDARAWIDKRASVLSARDARWGRQRAADPPRRRLLLRPGNAAARGHCAGFEQSQKPAGPRRPDCRSAAIAEADAPGVSLVDAGRQAPDGRSSELRDRLLAIGSDSSELPQAAFRRRSQSPRLSSAPAPNRATRATIAFPESDRPDGREPAMPLPRQQPSRRARRTTGSPRLSGSNATRGRRHPPRYCFPDGIGRTPQAKSDRPASADRAIASRGAGYPFESGRSSPPPVPSRWPEGGRQTIHSGGRDRLAVHSAWDAVCPAFAAAGWDRSLRRPRSNLTQMDNPSRGKERRRNGGPWPLRHYRF